MKRFFAMLLLAMFSVAGTAMAADQVGVYVAPKLSLGLTHAKLTLSGNSYYNGSDSFGSHTKSSFGGGLALGYDFSKNMGLNMRTELEYMIFGDTKMSGTRRDMYNTEKVAGKVGVQSVFLNVYYDYRNESAFVPYIGGGIGFGNVGLKGTNPYNFSGVSGETDLGRKRQTNLAWNLGLGVAYEFNESFALDLGYRYASFGSAKSASENNKFGSYRIKAKDVSMHQFTMGARVTF